MYALSAKAAIFRRARRLLPALAATLLPASVLSSQVCHAFLGGKVRRAIPYEREKREKKKKKLLYSPVGDYAP
jgi:hypothetical protein